MQVSVDVNADEVAQLHSRVDEDGKPSRVGACGKAGIVARAFCKGLTCLDGAVGLIGYLASIGCFEKHLVVEIWRRTMGDDAKGLVEYEDRA